MRSQTVENKGIEATALAKLAGIDVQGGSPADSSHVKGLSEIDDASGDAASLYRRFSKIGSRRKEARR